MRAALGCAMLFLSACAFEPMPDSFRRSPAQAPQAALSAQPEPSPLAPSTLSSIEGTWESNCSSISSAQKSVRAFLKITSDVMYKYWVTYSDKDCKNIERLRPIEVAGGAQKILRFAAGNNGVNIDFGTIYCNGQKGVELDIFKLDESGKLSFGNAENPAVRPVRFSTRVYTKVTDQKFTGLLLANMGKGVGSCDGR